MKQDKQNRTRRIMVILLIISLLISVVPLELYGVKGSKVKAVTRYGISNPTIDEDGVTIWDTVYFGNYYQSDIEGIEKEPIRWRVLAVEGDDAFLLADQNLDMQPYHNKDEEVTWEQCTLRIWLNNNFLTTAFTAAEQEAIQGENVENDKVFLLSIEEASNAVYGFDAYDMESDTRVAACTAYVKNNCWYSDYGWWLRNQGWENNRAAYVHLIEGTGEDYGCVVNKDNVLVRPALHLTLSSDTLWTGGSKVSSNGEEIEVEPTSTPTANPTVLPTSEPTASPTTLPTSEPTISPIVPPTSEPTINPTEASLPKKNPSKTIGDLKYKVTKLDKKNGTVAVSGVKSKSVKSLTIPTKVKINGYTFKVTAISAKAFQKCKKLKKLTIKTTTLKSIGNKAIKGTNKNMIIKVPKKQYKKYKKLFSKKSGFMKGMKIKK